MGLIAGRAVLGISAILGLLGGTAQPARAQDTVGGHIGFALPLVTREDGQTRNLADHFAIDFPVGITVKTKGRAAFDLEIVSTVEAAPRVVSVTIHPGVLWAVGKGYSVGIRAAFVANSAVYGFTPLLNKSWPIKGGEDGFFKEYFVEADLPVRFSRPVGGPSTDPVTFAMHFGLGF